MRYFLDISYKGTDYHGWQIQKNAVTVQEVLNKALRILLKHEVTSMGSGRTDTGVHAKQQYVQIDTDISLTQKNILNLNGILPNDIVVNHIYLVPPEASARFDAIQRSYEYFINKKANPFKIQTSYYFPKKLDIHSMNEAAGVLKSYNDFKAFSKSRTEVEHFLCDISEAFFIESDTDIVFNITANRFLRGMVRAIMGTLIEIGTGNLTTQGLVDIIEGRDRKDAGISVPPQGLFLSKVDYPDFLQVIS